MDGLQPSLLQETSKQTYSFPRLKHLPVREQPAYRVATDSDACSLAGFRDDVLLTFIITGEFRIYKGKTIYTHCLRALHNQYHSTDLCGGDCDSVKKQLVWLSTKQAMRTKTVDDFTNWYRLDLEDGVAVQQGKYAGYDAWEWGNYTKGSPFGRYIRGEQGATPYAYLDQDDEFFHPVEDKDYAGFIVMTYQQDHDCGNCLGW